MSTCPICTTPADKICSACQSISYCCAAHQKQHWKIHKASCTAFTIKTSERYGRQLVTTRDIKKGTVIFRDEPLAVGPKRLTVPVCIKCHRRISVDTFCSGCYLPVCHDCYDMPLEKTFHSKFECDAFKKAKMKATVMKNDMLYHPSYECILPLRCLQIQRENKENWQKLLTMAHNNEIRKNDNDLWLRNQVNVVNFLKNRSQLDFDEETVHTVIGIIDVNAYEILLNNVEACGVYRLGGLMNHDCKPNTIYIITENNVMIVIAAVDIPKGEMITTSYAEILEGTLKRRTRLKRTKYFDCVCTRCNDKTELGTFISAVKCQFCEGGYSLPVESNYFECQLCNTQADYSKLMSTLQSIGEHIENARPSIEEYEEILEMFSNVLHENHYLLLPVVQSLTKLYGRWKNYTYVEMDKKALLRKKELCQRYLSVLDKVDVPMGRRRGVTLYELHIAEYLLVKQLLESQEITKDVYRLRLKDVVSELTECRKILIIDKMITNSFSLVDILDDNIRCVLRDMNV